MKTTAILLAASLLLSGCCPCKLFHKKTPRTAGQVVEGRVMTEAAAYADVVQSPDGTRVDLKVDLLFQPDSALFDEKAVFVVDMLGETLAREGASQVLVTGHTDDRGETEQKAKLSLDRATAVAERLVAKGVPADRIETEGQADTEPMAANDTEEGRARNRRVEVLVVE
jgi:flagellar motor protein MotB